MATISCDCFLSKRLKANEERYTSISEAFGAYKELKVGNLEDSYIKRFTSPSKIYAKSQSASQILNQLPRYAIEAIAFGGMLLLTLYLMTKSGGVSFNNVLPIIALYVFAGYRLMPALQISYGAISNIRYTGPSLDALYNDFKKLQTDLPEQNQINLSLNNKITLKNIDYSYPNSSTRVLKNIQMDITACNTIGIAGSTGSGKTTLVDVILGLLEAQQGTLEVDSIIINKKNCRTWQRMIGYVPQHIYLTDNTIANNIAFGVDTHDINQEAVEKAAKIANINDFVVNELPLKYQTIVGERGVRLSGGQRQRIGIARALYNNPKLLIFDEATSALDNNTEEAVMDATHNLKKETTIILIAHRLTTMKKCDIIFLLEKGKLVDKGNYEELTKKNPFFKNMQEKEQFTKSNI